MRGPPRPTLTSTCDWLTNSRASDGAPTPCDASGSQYVPVLYKLPYVFQATAESIDKQLGCPAAPNGFLGAVFPLRCHQISAFRRRPEMIETSEPSALGLVVNIFTLGLFFADTPLGLALWTETQQNRGDELHSSTTVTAYTSSIATH